MDRLLETWREAHRQVARWEAQKDDARRAIERHMKTVDLLEYQNAAFRVARRTQTRSTLRRQDVPTDIWERYAVATPIHSLIITERRGAEASRRLPAQPKRL